MNDACLLKLCWNFKVNPDALWVRVLRGKYNRRSNSRSSLAVQSSDSALWKQLARLTPVIAATECWSVGNGQTVRVWGDNWIHEIGKLDPMTNAIPDSMLDWKVCDLVDENGQWNWARIHGLLPARAIDCLRNIPPPSSNSGDDRMIWPSNKFGSFTVASAYAKINDWDHVEGDPLWQRVWKIQGPERVRMFAWQVVHGRLLTNSRKSRWGLGSPSCLACLGVDEDILHVLRDCPKAKAVWLGLVKPVFRGPFFLSNFSNWITINLYQELGRHGKGQWSSTWATACASLWFWRNSEVHDRNFIRPPNAWWQILLRVQNYRAARSKPPSLEQNARILTSWNPPSVGWIRINSDGSCRVNSHEVGCGCVIRGSNGEWIRGYSKYLGVSSSPLIAELWGVLEGLQLAWNLDFKMVELHLDSLEAFNLLSGSHAGSYQGLGLISRISSLINRDWKVEINHIYRDSNRVADCMAKLSFSVDHPSDLALYSTPPPDVNQALLLDLLSTSDSLIQGHLASL
ncbi:hypothetical protein RIF29_25447 [Crotalaria pallida]|uniref:RNase H type-1 domain-containing protein n=1 Tax=Crotalaria pallida TaxID=3830 RepID=A0AAN9ELM7_CROPI